MEDQKKESDALSRIIDFIFSKDERKWLILVFALGFILRFFIARNIDVSVADEMVHGPHAIGFLHSGLISTIVHSPLWFYLVDIIFRILGVTLFSARFISVFYGAFSIFLVYLICVEIFSKRVALISSFLMAVSFLTVRYSIIGMDAPATFFLLSAMYFFITSMKNNKFPWVAAILIGLASLIKTLSLFFVPAFLIGFFLLSNSESEKSKRFKKNVWHILLFGLIIILLFSPILIHNYLWFKDKKMVDVYFAQYFSINKARAAYQGLLGYDFGFEYYLKHMPQTSEGFISELWRMDGAIFLTGFFGLILSFFSLERRRYWFFLLAFEFFGLLFLMLSATFWGHYITLIPVLCMFGGFFINWAAVKIKVGSSAKVILILLLLILFYYLHAMWPSINSQSAFSSLSEYTSKQIDKNSVVISDSRVYRGRTVFLFHDTHYLESVYFPQIMSINNNFTGESIPITVYFVECARDDCGWGSIANQPELNKSCELLFDFVKKNSAKEKVFYGGSDFGEEKGLPIYILYKTTINLKREVIAMIDSTHDWFYYPVNYIPKEKIFDQYAVNGFLDNIIYKFAWLVVIISILLAILSPFAILKEVYLRG
jgi:hypothetical protein